MAWAQPAGPCTSARPHSPCTARTPLPCTSPPCPHRLSAGCIPACPASPCSQAVASPSPAPGQTIQTCCQAKKTLSEFAFGGSCSHHSPARGHEPRGVPAPLSRCCCIYLLLSPARGRGRTVATGSGCPSVATGSTVPGMLGAAETFPFTFAWVLVPFVPAQVYSQREGGKGNAAIIPQPAGAEDQAKKGRLPQQNGLWGPPRGEDMGCWGAHVGLKYHGAPGSPAGGS